MCRDLPVSSGRAHQPGTPRRNGPVIHPGITLIECLGGAVRRSRIQFPEGQEKTVQTSRQVPGRCPNLPDVLDHRPTVRQSLSAALDHEAEAVRHSNS